MASLGELSFALGLDSKKFDDAIKIAKKKIAELGTDVSINVNVDAEKVAKQIQDELDKIQKSAGTGGTTNIKVELDDKSISNVKTQLAKLGEPIVTKIQVEYDAEKFQAVETAMKNFGKRVSESVNGELSKGGQKQSAPSNQTKKQGWFERGMEYVFGDDDDTVLQSKASSVDDLGNAIGRLTTHLAELNKQQEKRSNAAKSRATSVSSEEDSVKRELSQLRRLEEGVRRWENIKANISATKVDKDSSDYRKAIALIDEYISKLEEAKKSAGKFTDREMTEMLGQTLSGKAQEANRLIKNQKELEKGLMADFTKQQAQIQRFEESIRRIQNVKAKLGASDVDKNSSNYKQAISILDSYIEKLEHAKKSAGDFSRREMARLTGQTLSGDIAHAERLIQVEKSLARQKEQASKNAIRKERAEISLKKSKLQLSSAEQKLIKDKANARTAELKKQKESLRVKKERVSLQKKLNNSMKTGSTWATQLGNQFSNFISIYSIERFIRNLYTIGGEFQKQQIALRSMIGDANKADVIFERTKDMAVKSPFTFSELASYTKQLSAYGIEYNELYDTTKRLADISAGVGVDMGRLILAYGQVRSAEVLRGQELRQFTEAGIPLVAELAKRLEEVRGESVKIGEVFEAISKREISFGMVQDVLFDMTDPGGRFFEMQEELSKSLAGQWSNLKDAWDIMIADIAMGTSGPLNDLSQVARDILVSWRDWLPALSSVVGAIGAITSAVSLATIAQKAWTAAMAVNPWVRAASIILGVAGALGGWIVASNVAEKSTAQLNIELDKELQKWDENRTNALRYVDTLKASNTSEERRIALYRQLLELYPDLFRNMKMEELMLKSSAELRNNINEETAKQQIALIDKELQDKKIQLDSAKKAGTRESGLGTIKVRSLTEEEQKVVDDLKRDITELNLRKAEVQAIIDRQAKVEALTPDSSIEKYIELYGSLGKAVRILRKGGVTGLIANPKELTTTLEYYDQLNAALKDEEDIMKKFKPSTSEHKKAASMAKVYRDAISAIGGVWKDKAGDKAAKDKAKTDAQAYAEELKRKLSEESQKWNLYKQLFDATGNKGLSMRIAFDDSMTFVSPFMESLKKQLKEEATKHGVTISVEDLLGMGEKQLMAKTSIPEAVREKVAKGLGAIIEAYHSENKRLKNETIKDYIEIIKASKDFAAQIADVERDLAKQLETLESIHGKGTPEYERAAAEAVKRAEEKKTSIEFEKFKESSDWVKVFDDLDRVSNATLDSMIKNVEEFARRTNLGVKETKELVEALGKLRDESIERNPLKGFKDAWNRLKNFKSLNQKVGEYNEHGVLITQQMVDDGIAAANKDLEEAALAVAGKFDAVGEAANFIGNALGGVGEGLQNFGSILNGISSGAQTGAGIASALGYSGPWGAIAGAAVGMLTSVFEMHDKALQKEIEASQAREKMIEHLSDILEQRLTSSAGGIYTIGLDDATKKTFSEFIEGYNGWIKYKDSSHRSASYRKYKKYSYLSEDTIASMQNAIDSDSYYTAQLASLRLQKDELEKQKKDLQSSKKDKTTEIQDKSLEIGEIEREITSLSKDIMDTLYGIDFKDWASQFTDSIVDAWASGEDAAEAYKKTVSDVMRNVAASVIQQGIIGKWLEDNMKGVLDLFAESDGKITTDVYSALAELASGIGGKIGETEEFLDAWEEALNKYGHSMKDMADSSSSGSLSKGIQSVTEDTASLLGSYLNSIRQSVHVKQQLLEKLVSDDIPQMSYIAQAQLQELNQIAANTKRNADAADKIYDLVNRVVDKGSNKIKV